MSHASGGIDGCPNASQPSATNGMRMRLEATTPAVAVRSGSPAVLSRMFHAACSTAAMAIATSAAESTRRV